MWSWRRYYSDEYSDRVSRKVLPRRNVFPEFWRGIIYDFGRFGIHNVLIGLDLKFHCVDHVAHGEREAQVLGPYACTWTCKSSPSPSARVTHLSLVWSLCRQAIQLLEGAEHTSFFFFFSFFPCVFDGHGRAFPHVYILLLSTFYFGLACYSVLLFLNHVPRSVDAVCLSVLLVKLFLAIGACPLPLPVIERCLYPGTVK